MSQDLPPRPSLEYLRKRAKELLDELRRTNADAKLADAFHALARHHGFATWPKLKAHVEAPPRVIDHPFAGRWIADVSRSKRHPMNEFRSATLEFAVVGDTVTVSDVVVDASGAEARGENTILADGEEYLSEHGNGYALRASWNGLRVLETVATKDGQVVGRGIYEVSADGHTLTVSTSDPSDNGDGWQSDSAQVTVLARG